MKFSIAGTRPMVCSAKNAHDDADRVRQHHADGRAFRRQRRELGAEHLRARDQLAVGELRAERILDGGLARVARLLRFDERRKQRLIEVGGSHRRFDHDDPAAPCRRPGGAPCPCRPSGTSSFSGGRMVTVVFGNQRLPRLEAVEVAEMAPLRPVDAHRHDDRVRLVGDHRRAVVDLHQAARHRETAFGENHQRLAALHRLDQMARAERLGRIDGLRVDELQERLDPALLRHRRIDGERRMRRQDRIHDRRIEQAHMVGRDDRARPGRRQVFVAAHLEAHELS